MVRRPAVSPLFPPTTSSESSLDWLRARARRPEVSVEALGPEGSPAMATAAAPDVLSDELMRALAGLDPEERALIDRKSTRLNSSHANISYAVFCLKKKKRLL